MDRSQFLAVYEQLKSELLADSDLFSYSSDSRSWTEKSLDQNVPGGKLNRGLSVVHTLATLSSPDGTLPSEEGFKAAAVGWCIEWLQAHFLVLDDIMDKSITRRGQPCWYRMPKVGMIAVNDGILLNSHIFAILRRHLRSHPSYLPLLELFHEVTYQTAFGQMVDLITTPEGEVDLNKYTMDTYLKIVQYKTAYYSFYMPVAAALLLSGRPNLDGLEAMKDILVRMGTYFQVQDDFLDCFGDPEVIGKVGTDIQDTKCSWLVVTALQKATDAQRGIIMSNYGKDSESSISAIKQLYSDLQIKEAFLSYEQESYEQLTTAIKAIDDERLQAALTAFLHRIYKRQK